MKKLLMLGVIFFITSCQSISIRSNNTYIQLKQNATIEIIQELAVSPGSARVFLQNGSIKADGNINLYEVNCEVEINTVSEVEQSVSPGLFHVIAVRQEESPIVFLQPVNVASFRSGWAGDSPVDIKRFYHFVLKSETNQQVRAVICRGVQDNPFNAELPTIEEMKKASGNYLRFNF